MGKGDDGSLAVIGAGELLGIWENDLCVDRSEDAETVVSFALRDTAKCRNLLVLNLVADTDEEVCTEALVVASRDKVVEAYEADSESLSLGVG